MYLIELMPLPSAGCASGSTCPKRPHTGSGVKASENRAENDRYGYLDSWVASSVLLGVTWPYAPRGTGDNRGNGAEECESDHTTSLGPLRSWLHPQSGAAAIRLLMTVAGDSAVIHAARGGDTRRRHARQRRSSTSSRARSRRGGRRHARARGRRGAMDAIGGTVATTTIAADSGGYHQLLEWAHSFRSINAIIQTTIGSHTTEGIHRRAVGWDSRRELDTAYVHQQGRLRRAR